LAASEATQRVCYGIELDPKYCDVTVLRWQQQSGKKAVLDGDRRTFEEIARERLKETA
jgi:DNA modification methylase